MTRRLSSNTVLSGAGVEIVAGEHAVAAGVESRSAGHDAKLGGYVVAGFQPGAVGGACEFLRYVEFSTKFTLADGGRFITALRINMVESPAATYSLPINPNMAGLRGAKLSSMSESPGAALVPVGYGVGEIELVEVGRDAAQRADEPVLEQSHIVAV